MAENKKRGSLIVISGFSGVGKGTVVKRLVSDFGYNLSVSATTRSPREGEVDGREYYFMERSEFENLIDYGGFIEWTQYVENYYGTPKKYVEKSLEEGKDIILEIEVMGALNVKKQFPDALLILSQSSKNTPYSSDVRDIPVVILNVFSSFSPSNRPMVMLVFPASIANNMISFPS